MTRTTFLPILLTAATAIAIATFAQCGDERPTAPLRAAEHAPAAQSPAPPAATAVGERIHVIVSGSMLGRLEPCGCASGQLGGLPRRIVHIREVHGADLLLEGGDLVAGTTPLDLEKAYAAVNVLFGMETRYDVLGVGPNDLALPLTEWGGYLAGYQAPVVAADLVAAESSPFVPRAFVEKDVRGTMVRVVSLTMRLPPGAADAPLRQAVQLIEPAAAWARGLEGADAATLRILMVHDEPDRVRALARELTPRPDLAIGIDDTFHEPPAAPELAGDVPVVFPGIRGRHLVEVQFGRTTGTAALPRYEIVPLRGSETKSDAGQDPAVRQVLLDHRQWVADQHLREAMADQQPTQNGATYIGNSACGKCHEADYRTWQNSKHAHAWQTLEQAEKDPKRYGWPVTKYPDCVSCHVVGYGQKTGFASPETTPDLANVGCERCHGPGSAHQKAPKEARMGRVGNGAPSIVCAQCHDFEQSPDFVYGTRWAVIQHGVKLK